MGYQVTSGGITRELDKEPSLHCSSIYISYMWSVLQQYVYLMSIHHASTSCPVTHPHVFSLRPPCFLHVPWRHTFNLCYTCVYHVYTMRNPCPLMSSLTLTPSRLFPILLDPNVVATTRLNCPMISLTSKAQSGLWCGNSQENSTRSLFLIRVLFIQRVYGLCY